MNVSADYFTVLFAMLLTKNIVDFSKGLIWIPVVHALLLFVILLVDKKETKAHLTYNKYSRMKIYDCAKNEALLMQ